MNGLYTNIWKLITNNYFPCQEIHELSFNDDDAWNLKFTHDEGKFQVFNPNTKTW